MFALDALLEAYPDAKFLWSHRDPAKVLGRSAASSTTCEAGAATATTRWSSGPSSWTAGGRPIAARDGVPGAGRRATASPTWRSPTCRCDPVGALGGGATSRSDIGFPDASREAVARWADSHEPGSHGQPRLRAGATSGSTPTRCASASPATWTRTMPRPDHVFAAAEEVERQWISDSQTRRRSSPVGARAWGGPWPRSWPPTAPGWPSWRGAGTRSTRPWRRSRAAGSPDAVGISVDMTDPRSIDAGFGEVGERWGSLNILVHTIGPGAGRFEATRRQRLGRRRSRWAPCPPCAACAPRCRCCGRRSGAGSRSSRRTRFSGRARSSWPTPRRRRP